MYGSGMSRAIAPIYSPVLVNPMFQQQAVDFSEGFFAPGPPPASMAGFGGMLLNQTIEYWEDDEK